MTVVTVATLAGVGMLVITSVLQGLCARKWRKVTQDLRNAIAAHSAARLQCEVFVQTSRVRAALVVEALKMQNEAYKFMREGRTEDAFAAWDKGQGLVRSVIARYEHDEAKYADLGNAVMEALRKVSGE